MIDDNVIEGRCCVTDKEVPCSPVLDGPCKGSICSVGMAGTGLFKLGCLDLDSDGENVVSFYNDGNLVICFLWFLCGFIDGSRQLKFCRQKLSLF